MKAEESDGSGSMTMAVRYWTIASSDVAADGGLASLLRFFIATLLGTSDADSSSTSRPCAAR